MKLYKVKLHHMDTDGHTQWHVVCEDLRDLSDIVFERAGGDAEITECSLVTEDVWIKKGRSFDD